MEQRGRNGWQTTSSPKLRERLERAQNGCHHGKSAVLPTVAVMTGEGSRSIAEPSSVAVPPNCDSYPLRDEQGELLRAAVSALCAARWRTVDARSGTPPAVVRADTRAIGGTRRGPTRRARVRPRPPVQSLCPLDAWRMLRDEPWRRYRHQVTTTEECVRVIGGAGRAQSPTWCLRRCAHLPEHSRRSGRTARLLRGPQAQRTRCSTTTT